ncbi:MAG TPA: helix-turn-helix domain-containing protein [Saprospiraceae bacterium]|nr:helix-turn-helix domain-containing protein [Saprospiraceae bacterium]
MENLTLLSKKELLEMLKVSAPTLDRAVRSGDLKAVRIGRRVLFNPKDVATYIERKTSLPETLIYSQSNN